MIFHWTGCLKREAWLIFKGLHSRVTGVVTCSHEVQFVGLGGHAVEIDFFFSREEIVPVLDQRKASRNKA